MPLSPEQRAQIARENGAKSRGPVTPEGKSRSSRNALKHGGRAEKLALFLPTHDTVLCNEDRDAFARLLDHLSGLYQPANPVAASIVNEIANAHWQLQRLNHCLTIKWNLAIARGAAQPLTVAEEMAELEALDLATNALFNGDRVVSRINADIDRLYRRIATLERRFHAAQANFPQLLAPERTESTTESLVENTALTPESAEPETTDEPPVYVSEDTPAVIAAYRREFPGRRIVVLPPDNVAKGILEEDDLLAAPRLRN